MRWVFTTLNSNTFYTSISQPEIFYQYSPPEKIKTNKKKNVEVKS